MRENNALKAENERLKKVEEEYTRLRQTFAGTLGSPLGIIFGENVDSSNRPRGI